MILTPVLARSTKRIRKPAPARITKGIFVISVRL
jgi:hypothetical protein